MTESLESSSGTPLRPGGRRDNTPQALAMKLAVRRWLAGELNHRRHTHYHLVLDVFPGQHVMRRAWPPEAVFVEGLAYDGLCDIVDCDPWGDPWRHLVALTEQIELGSPCGIVWTDGTGIDQRLTGGVSAALAELTGVTPARGLARGGVWEVVQRRGIAALAERCDRRVVDMRWASYRNMFYAAALLA